MLLDQDGHPRVADFGQSRLSTDETPALGTLFYMAPEQADMTAVPDASWDVYSLGCLLFSMLTGKPPYHSADLAAQIETTAAVGERLLKYRDALYAAEKPTAHRKVAGVDRALADTIDRCIAANPNERYNSIESVLAALENRDIAQARRPLMLLGILGPLLLLTVFGLFGMWAFIQAETQANEAVGKKAIEGNDYTAKLVSRIAQQQIEEYFRSVTDLAYDDSFAAEYQQAMANESLMKLRYQLADPADNSKLNELRQQYQQHPAIEPLQEKLEYRLENPGNVFPKAASWFICDRLGNQVASAFPMENKTLGQNFAYRTYFSGAAEDAKHSDIPPVGPAPVSPSDAALNETTIAGATERQIIDRPYLSPVFKSTQTNTWKVAFSAPIVSNNQVIGIVAVTAELGDFVIFEAKDTRYWMLVDERKNGVILGHPIYRDLKNKSLPVPQALSEVSIDIEKAKRFNKSNLLDFKDPIGKLDIGEDRNVYSKYDHDSIVSVEPVSMKPAVSPLKSDDAVAARAVPQTAFSVLVVHNQEDVLADVKALEHRLNRLAILASFVIMLVLACMGYFVYRLLRASKSRLMQPSLNDMASETFSAFPTLKQQD